MYEESVGTPLIMVPAMGESVAHSVVNTNVSHIDLYPTIVAAVTGQDQTDFDGRRGISLWDVANQPDHDRIVFSEYHAMYSSGASFMLRDRQYKYIHYVDFPPQLFDCLNDPLEVDDLSSLPEFMWLVSEFEKKLRTLVQPEDLDRLCKDDGLSRIASAGGKERILEDGMRVLFTPAPIEFNSE